MTFDQDLSWFLRPSKPFAAVRRGTIILQPPIATSDLRGYLEVFRGL